MHSKSKLGLASTAILGFLALSGCDLIPLPAFAVEPVRLCQYAVGVNGSNNCVDIGPNQTVNGLTTFPLHVTVDNAASIIIGTVDIDQTTPGTTNGVVVNSSALPTGAATAANQSTGNSSLSSIVTNTNAWTYTNIPTSTSTVIKSAAGVIGGLTVNTGGTLSSAVVYDNTTCTGTKIATFSTTSQASLPFPANGAAALTGICVTTSDTGGAANVTVYWR